MRTISLLTFLAVLGVGLAIPMPPQSEILPDGIVPFAPYNDDVDSKLYRLPNETIPIHYTISLTTDIDKGEAGQEFSGKVRIRVRVLAATPQITVHVRQLTIETIALYSTAEPPVLIQDNISPRFEEDFEFLHIQPTAALVVGTQYFVDITYKGLLRDDNMGFYRSTYKNEEGQTVWLATTQFEQTDARHAFPCYDEPQIRTPFLIDIKHNAKYNAISNMPGTTEVVAGTEYVIDRFEETPPVQTYLIAFVVSDFESIENQDRIKQRVFAKPQSIAAGEADLGLDAGKKILDKFQSHLGVPYNLPKMDQIAVPDFDAGAMENWGLVTYREEYLLYNKDIATTRQRENIITIISHEYAHQWFGNHVAPKWWSYLWLNEGFATLYEDYLTSLVYPEDRLMDLFVVDTVQPVLETDANPSIRPMTFYVESPERIAGLFDRVAYSKSGSVLRMMQVALGVDTWTKGLRFYLGTKQYEAADSDDLYKSLQQAVDEDYETNPPNVSTIMKTWENQAGYPTIYVSRNPNNQISFSQERFFYSDAKVNSIWQVPINYVVGSNPNFEQTSPDFWLTSRNRNIPAATAPKPWTIDDWIVVNIQESSYYRVNYDPNLWALLIKQLHGNEYDKIHVLNRAQLVDDSLNLARAGLTHYNIALDILRYLEVESDYPPWAAANRGLTLLNRWMRGSLAYANYQKFVREIVEPLFNKLGVEVIEDEPKLDRYARSTAINLACEAGLVSCLTQTSAKLQGLVAGTRTIAPDLQSAIYCNGVRRDNAISNAGFSFLQNKIFASEDQAERTLIINALGCSQTRTLLMNFLNLAVQPGSSLRLQEKSRVLVAPVNNGDIGLDVMIDFIESNYKEILEISPNQVNTMLANIAPRVSSSAISTKFHALLEFLEQESELSAEISTGHKATAQANFDWQEKYLEEIDAWLRDGTPTEPPIGTTNAPTEGPTEPNDGRTTSTTLGAGSVMVSMVVLSACAFLKFLL